MKEFIEKLIGRLEELNLDGIRMIEDGKYELIRKKEAISIVYELAEEYINTSTDTSTECNKALDSLHKKILSNPKMCEIVTEEEIMALVEAKNNGWIPCSERLPDVSGDYLTYVYYDDYENKYYSIEVDEIDCDGRVKVWNRNSGKIVAWQPLPAAWKGVENGKK